MRPMNNLLESLTYRDLAGRRRPRRYALAAAAITLLIGALVVWGWRQRMNFPAIQAGAPALASTGGEPENDPAAPTDAGIAPLAMQPSSASTQTPPPAASPTPETCPHDPAAWELVPLIEGDHFQRILPACVYADLARTVAWDLLRVLGYSGREATELAGFARFPWRPLAEITGYTNTRGPMTIALDYAGDAVRQQLNHPDYRLWIVDNAGNPGMTFTLRGCYRTAGAPGEQAESMQPPYPMVCVVSVDQTGWAVLELGSHRYTLALGATRQFALYGYAGDGLWEAIGYQAAPVVEILPPGSSGPAVMPLAMEWEQAAQDRGQVAVRHGLSPWDAAWLGDAFDLRMRPLPENWPAFNDPAELRAIQEAVDLGLERRVAP